MFNIIMNKILVELHMYVYLINVGRITKRIILYCCQFIHIDNTIRIITKI